MASRSVPVEVSFLGNTKDLEAALERAGVVADESSKKIQGSAQQAARAAAEQARAMGASADEQEAAAARAAVAFTQANDKITTSQRAAGEAAAMAARQVGASMDEQKAAYTRAIATQAQYEAAVKSASEQAARAAKQAAAQQAEAARSAAKAQEEAAAKSRAANKTLSDFGGKVLKVGLAGLGVAAYEGVKGFMRLQQSMEQLHTQAGASQTQVQHLTKSILNMAGSVATTPQQLADGMYHVVSSLNATIPPAQRSATELKVLRTAAEGAKMGNADLVDVTNALDAAVVSGIHGVQNYGQAMGALNATVGAGDMKMQDLADALGTGILSSAQTAGLSLKDVGAALAVFGDNNMRGAMAATRLRMSIMMMAAPSQAATKWLAAIGMTSTQMGQDMRSGGLIKALADLKQHLIDSGATASQQAMILARVFGGGRTSAGVLTLMNQLDRLRAKYKQIDEGAHRFGSDYGAYTHTLSYQFDALKATVSALADKFGQYLIPKLEAVAQATESVVGWFEKHRAAATALAAVITGVLGTAMTMYVAGKVAKFITGTEQMVVGMSKVVSFITGGFIPALERTGPGITQIGVRSQAMAAEVETADTQIEAANTTAGASFTTLGADATAAVATVDTGAATMAATMETAGTSIEATNVAIGASFTAMLGPIGAVLATIPLLEAAFGPGPKKANQYFGGSPGGTRIGPAGMRFGLQLGPPSHHSASYGGYGGDQPGVGSHGVSLPAGYGATGPGGPWLGAGGKVTNASFAASVLARIGAPTTMQNVNALAGWIQREGNDPFVDKHNPLDTTKAGWGGVSTNSVGVKSYPTWAAGLAATVATLRQSNFAAIVASLKGGHGLTGPGVSSELAAWSGGGYSAAAPVNAASQLPPALRALLAGKSPSASSKAIKSLLYANPLAGDQYTVERTDQGKDYGSISGGIHAIGAGIVTLAQNLNGFGQTIVERLTQGPNKGRYIYYGLETGANPAGAAWHQGAHVSAGQLIAQGRGSGGVEFGFWNPKTGHAMGYQPGVTSGGVTPAGTVFAQWMAHLAHGNTYLTSHGGITTGGGGNYGYQLVQAMQRLTAAIQKSAQTLLARYGTVEQAGTARTLSRALGLNTGALGSLGKSGQWALETQTIGGLLHNVIEHLGGQASLGQISHATGGLIAQGVSGSAQEQKYQQTVLQLIATGQKHLAAELVAAHKAAMATAGQEMYAQQTLKDGEMLSLQATELKDQTQKLSDWANDTLNVIKSQAQQASDQYTAQTTQIKDMAQTVHDAMSGMATAIKDQTALMSDRSGGIVSAIQDQTQIQVDQIGERGLFGLNLIAQKLQVKADEDKAYWDQQINNAKLQLDTLQSQADAAETAAQLNLDQVQTAQDQLVALAQQHLDTVTVSENIRIAAAQAKLDAVTAHVDATEIGPAQMAVDLGATLPKAQQDVLNAQLKRAEGAGRLQEARAGRAYQNTYDTAQRAITDASTHYTNVQNSASRAIQQASDTLQSITDTYNVVLSNAGQHLQGVQNTAAQVEAADTGAASVASATAQHQYMGSGLVVNITGIQPTDASAVADAVGWQLRTALPA